MFVLRWPFTYMSSMIRILSSGVARGAAKFDLNFKIWGGAKYFEAGYGVKITQSLEGNGT